MASRRQASADQLLLALAEATGAFTVLHSPASSIIQPGPLSPRGGPALACGAGSQTGSAALTAWGPCRRPCGGLPAWLLRLHPVPAEHRMASLSWGQSAPPGTQHDTTLIPRPYSLEPGREATLRRRHVGVRLDAAVLRCKLVPQLLALGTGSASSSLRLLPLPVVRVPEELSAASAASSHAAV